MLRSLFAAILWLAACAHAAEPPPRPYWQSSLLHKAWTRESGAPTAVYGMTQDARGMLWFAATDGLYRFDGVRFERLTAIDSNPLRSLNTNAVLAVGNALWVGYNFGGISVFDQGTARHYGADDGASIRTVYHIARTRDGSIWMSTSEGLYRLDGQRWRHIGAADGLPPGNVHYFTDLPDGSLLVDNPDGLYRSTVDGARFRKVAGGRHMEAHQLLPNGDALLVDRQRAFYRYSSRGDTVTPLPLPTRDPGADPFLDARGALWINTDAGLALAAPDGRLSYPFTGLNSLSGKQVYHAMDDREGNLWLTTENGVDRIRESRLTTIPLPPNMLRQLSVQTGGDGTVWIGNHRTNGDYLVATFGLRPDGSKLAVPASNITATLRAPDGSVWLANNAALWRGENGRWKEWPLPPGLRGNDVQALAMDGHGRMWVSVVHNGAHLFQDGHWQAGGGNPALARRTPVSLYNEAPGRAWFGYPANRLALFDGQSVREYGPADGLAVGNVAAIASHQGRLWVAGDQGVAVMEGGRFTAALDAQGQPLGAAAALVFTRGGELWLHGADGLTRITGAALAAGMASHRYALDRFNYLDGHEGKPSQVRPLSALSEAPDGRLWYATSTSVGWVDPAHILRNTQAPSAQVTALRTDQRRYDALPGLVLPQRTSNLELEFSAAVLGIPERVRFRYRLLGQEQEWRDASARRSAIYTNLGPGNYRFEVLAANEDGVWSAAPASFAFRIEPAFVQTPWFKLLCGLLLLLLAGLLYWWRIALVTARLTDRLRERLRERERIARTLHDHFLQTVQALMMQFDLIRHELPAADPLRDKIRRALDHADTALAEGREQVLALRLNHELGGDLETALTAIGHIFAPRYHTRFTLAVNGTPQPLLGAAAAEAYAIGREAMLNAFRHARSEQVTVELDYAARQFTLQVSDHGCGMSAEVYARGHRPGHFGLTGMRERAAEAGGTLDIRSEMGRGTTITLRLPARRAYAEA
ncbi:signal transduction histidine kinase/ligand-binding sensor domain-containing protein [Duganella sp. 1224]|uniref:sensor histidine kinase n=1 Tax=Duganella sp. 1224 TaxID=2587052 RepID=UPI0015C78F39|nr:sensor histidine kinase [Duganella sp. 1224]NYE62778.1 signal transduction histidine kinase/ligand-binding sensor domain-containing protein [Duganella sp. 1224]